MFAARYDGYVFVESHEGKEYFKLRRKEDCERLAERIGKAAFDIVTSDPGTWYCCSTLNPLIDGQRIPRT